MDTARSRLFVFANRDGEPRYVTDFYISLGKNGVEKRREGDQKTPLGVYTIVSVEGEASRLLRPRRLPDQLPQRMGQAARRNGYGIWLHGTPSETYSRPPRATDGCVALTNEDLRRLARYVDVGRTPVVISEGVEWVAPERWQESRREFLAAFEQWRADWESLDTDRYLVPLLAALPLRRQGLRRLERAEAQGERRQVVGEGGRVGPERLRPSRRRRTCSS